MDDVKQKGARERSRFYLFNPEYDRGEEYERRYGLYFIPFTRIYPQLGE